MSEEITTVDVTSQHIVINQDRSVAVPSLIKKSIVQHDHNIERLTFDCPRYWYGKDISTLNIYVNYISVSQKAKGDDPGSSLCENAVIDESDQDMMHFDWVITNNISQVIGGLLFLVCAKSVDSDGNEDVHWNSHLCKDLEVQEGLEASDSIVKKYPDVIEQIFQRLDNVDGVSPEQIAAAVEEYLVENPPSGMTADEKAQLNKNTEDISQLSDEIADKATLENGVVKFWKTSTEENRTDTLLYSVDISSIGGTGGLDLENLTLSVSQVGNYQRLSMSDGTTTKNVDIPITTITDEQVSTAVQRYLEENPVSGLDASTAETNQVPVADGNGNWSWQTQQSGTGSEETDPTVPNWAKQPNKPTYTADEVGALPDTTKIPSKTSDLQNDSGFLTEHQDLSGYALKSEVPKSASDVGADAAGTAESKVSAHNVSDTAHNDIRLLVQGLTERLNALADSDDTTLDQMSEIVSYIKYNRTLINSVDANKVNVSDIVNNLTSNNANKPLSAKQGRVLKALIDAIATVELDESLSDNTKAAPAGVVGELKTDLSQLSEENDALKTEIEALMVNAKSYGIKGDGETDDSILLNDLVTKLNTEGGGVIYLPDGKYRLNTRITWKSNVSLVGESHNAVLMPYCDNSVSQGFAAISWLNTDSTKQNGYDASNPFINCHFKNFTIDGINQNPANYDSYPKGINMHFLKDCTFENIQFLNTFATGLGIDFLENVFIHNIYCFNCGRGYEVKTEETISGGAGIGIGTMGMSKESCIISDCITDGCGNYGIFLEGGSIFPENGCKSHYTIANCQCINGRNYGIAVKGTDNVVIANNIMRDNARDGFALLLRPDRCCKGIEVSNNLSKSNGSCGFRFADGDYTDIISSELYVVGNVSEKNTKDGILISSVITKAFFNNNSIIENARGIAIADNDYFDVYFSGNMILNCTQNAVVKGLFKNTNLLTNQLVKLIPVHDMDYINGYVDDSGTEIEHSSSKTTKSFTYCKGSQYCGFYFDSDYTKISNENRICYCHWYDDSMNFISRIGEIVNGKGYKRFERPDNAAYVKYRVGVNKGTLQNSQLKGVYLVRYMTDRCEIN